MKIGIIGKGKWGANIARTLQELDVRHVVCQEPRNENAVGRFLDTPHLSHVVLAVPPTVQPKYALWVIEDRGLPCFLEKPLALYEEEALEIQAAARERHVPVLVDFVWLWHPAFMELKQRVAPIPIRKIRSRGGAQGPFRTSHDELWDWAPHDLSMVLSLMENKEPRRTHIFQGENRYGERCGWTVLLDFDGVEADCDVGSHYTEKHRELYVRTDLGAFTFDGVRNTLMFNGASLPFTYTPPLQLALSEFVRCERNDLQSYTEHATLGLAVQITHILKGGK